MSEEVRANYLRRHETLSDEKLADLEKRNIERYGRAYDWDTSAIAEDPETFDQEETPSDDNPDAAHDGAEVQPERDEPPTEVAGPSDEQPSEGPRSRDAVRLNDPVRDGPWTAERGEVKIQQVRMGDRIVNEQDESRSKGELFRQKAMEKADDTAESLDKASEAIQQFIRDNRPTNVRSETRADLPSYEVPHHHVDGGSLLVGLYATGLVTGKLVKKAQDAIRARRDDTDAGDR